MTLRVYREYILLLFFNLYEMTKLNKLSTKATHKVGTLTCHKLETCIDVVIACHALLYGFHNFSTELLYKEVIAWMTRSQSIDPMTLDHRLLNGQEEYTG